MQDRPELLAALMEEMAGQDGLHRPGPFWQGYAARTAAALDRNGLDGFRGDPERGRGFADVEQLDPLHGWPDPVPMGLRAFRRLRRLPLVGHAADRWADAYRSRAAAWRARRLAASMEETVQWMEDKYGIPATLHGRPQRCVDVAGHRIGENYLRAFAWLRDLDEAAIQPQSVLEIGGGFGAFSHVLQHCFQPDVHVYVDIPPILYIGTQYLAAHLPVDDHLSTRTRVPLVPRSGVVTAIPPWRLQDVETEIQLTWNSSSLQEMSPAIAEEYARQVARLRAPGGRLGIYLYDGGHVATLPPPQVVEILRAAGLPVVPAGTNHARMAVPGRLYLDAPLRG